MIRLKCEYMSASEDSGDEYQRDEAEDIVDSHNIHPVKQQSFPDPPYSSPVNLSGPAVQPIQVKL